MGLFDAFRYDGKRVLVVGGATGMGAAVAEVVKDAGAEVVVMDRADVDARRREVHPPRPVRQGIDRGGHRRVRRPARRAVRVRRRCRRHAGHRADQLHRPPPPGRPDARQGLLGRGAAIGFISSAAGFGWENNLPSPRSSSRSPTSTRRRSGSRTTARPTTCSASSRSTPMSRSRRSRCSRRASGSTRSCLARPTPRSPGERRHVARVRSGLPRRDRHRALDAARAGVPAGVPLQRRGRRVTGITMVTDAGYFASGVVESFEPRPGRRLPLRPDVRPVRARDPAGCEEGGRSRVLRIPGLCRDYVGDRVDRPVGGVARACSRRAPPGRPGTPTKHRAAHRLSCARATRCRADPILGRGRWRSTRWP